MIIYSADQLNLTPKKIVSVVPSQTELLFALGLSEEVIGITKFCVHPPEWISFKTNVGGTKNLNIALINRLNPHLIIANKEENDRDQIEELAKNYTVLLTDVCNYTDAKQMILEVGTITATKQKSIELVNQIETKFTQLAKEIAPTNHLLNTAYLIWKDPIMTIGGDTFISDLLKKAGLNNMFAQLNRYPVVTLKDLEKADCILLSSEPYPFKQNHINELLHHFPDKKIALVDGEFFSWYGSRMLSAPDYFKHLHNLLL